MYELLFKGKILSTYDTQEEADNHLEYILDNFYNPDWKKRMSVCFEVKKRNADPHNCSKKALISKMCALHGIEFKNYPFFTPEDTLFYGKAS